ncbi:MAG: RAMP superfamily CRISPR-associated protein [Neisseria sp.]|nr:RAMP superfamily CRISPR-associated protein [Neisseria sp.]
MSTAFLQNHQLYLTPLSPLHLGTGEDYEPTNYVIENSILYAFDPSQAALTSLQRNELLEITKRGDIFSIQNYFKKHGNLFADCAHKAVGVSRALENEYQRNLGKAVNQERGGNKVGNSFLIERTATHPINHQPYIPGSALKGCLRTAVLDRLSKDHHGERPVARDAARYESRLLGSFASDGLRLLKTADFMPTDEVATQIQYATNHKKRKIIKDGQEVKGKGATGRRETIQHGQYRAFQAAITIQKLLLAHQPPVKSPEKNLPSETVRPRSLQQLAADSNRYHLARFNAEIKILQQRDLVEPEWLDGVSQLLISLMPLFNQGKIMLVRLGKHGGAESKTLTGLAQIEINQGNGKSTFEPQTKTVWLAAQSDKETHGLLPFGWALIEIDPQGDNSALQNWCQQNSSHLNNVQAINRQLIERRRLAAEKIAAQKAEAEAAERARIEAEAEARAAEAARAAELAAMNPAERLIAEWKQKLQDFPFDSRNDTANSDFFNQLKNQLTQAAIELDDHSKQQIAAALSFKQLETLKRGLFVGKREKEIKAVLRQLRGE